jgi:hypothetical protein
MIVEGQGYTMMRSLLLLLQASTMKAFRSVRTASPALQRDSTHLMRD